MSIVFMKNNKAIVAKIIATVTEPLETSDTRQVVFFCKDKDGNKYRVPKNEMLARSANVKNNRKKVKAKRSKRERRKRNE